MTAPADSTAVPSRRAHVSSIGNRRALLGGIAIAPLLALPALAALHPDAEILRLGRLMEAHWEVERQSETAGAHDQNEDEPVETAFHKTRQVVIEIEAATASTLEGLRVKARACLWCHSGELPTLEDFEAATTDVRLAVGIVRDLLTMGDA